MEIKDIIELMKAVSDNGLTKFEMEHGDTRLVMKKEKQIVTVSGNGIPSGGMVMQMGQDVNTAAVLVANSSENANQEAENAGDNVIKSPLVGTFYSSPSPEAESYVKVGDQVKKGQVLGLVEAMKLMNEIESEYDGVVEAILVENESPVEYGQPLFRIR